MKATMMVSVACLLMSLPAASEAQQPCTAPKEWFPHEKTPEPDFHAPGDNCEFHQWAWQSFLWLTQPTGKGRIRLLDQPMAGDLFLPGRRPPRLTASVHRRLQRQPLDLRLRIIKDKEVTTFEDIRQAGSRGMLIDQNGRSVYYASHVSTTFYDYVRKNELYIREVYVKAKPTDTFPVKSLELKSSWRIVPKGEDASKRFYTTTARIHPLVCRNGKEKCEGDDVVVDRTRTEKVTVALVGLHVVGVVEDHPEFIWATFEHIDNAPDLPDKMPTNSPNPVSNRKWTFYRANTPAKDCNQPNKGTVSLDAKKHLLGPITDVFRQFPLGGGDATDQKNIKALNDSVRSQLDKGSIWRNYFLVGSVWLPAGALKPVLAGAAIRNLSVGSVRLANSTMETFSQASNCFACHNTAVPPGTKGIPAMNMNLSHVLINGLVRRDRPLKIAAARIAKQPLKSFADVQALLDGFIKRNNIPIQNAPHGAFWKTNPTTNKPVTYKDFTEGDIPNVTDPATGNPLKILKKMDSKNSNLIMALRGTKGSIFDPDTGTIGRMPPSGPFMVDSDIDRLAAWIDANCPDGP